MSPSIRLAAVAWLAAAGPALAADWPQWMGPNRDAVWPETGILDKFPDGGPTEKWRKPIGGGFAGPAVVAGKVYVTDKVLKPGQKAPDNDFALTKTESTERVLCLDAKTGEQIWKYEYDCPYTISYQQGPRCTPTVADGKVYALGAMGDLVCLDAAKGDVVWKKNFPKDYESKHMMWGYTGHPLVYKNLVICLAGGKDGAAVAFDKDSGKEVWKALPATTFGYCPPTLVEAGGMTQVVFWLPTSISGLNPETGAVYWKVPVKAPNQDMSIMAPRRAGDYLYAGGNGGAQVVLKLATDKPGASVVWQQDPVPYTMKAGPKGMAAINMTPFAEDGVIYGVDQPGMFRAFKAETGERLWWTFKPVLGKDEDEDFKNAGTATAFVVKNGDRYFIFADIADLIIAKLSPKGYEEVSRAHLKLERNHNAMFNRKVVWCHPAFADKCMFVRNDKEIVCYSLAKE
jgi:outer membrane protein assembly factor BamB